MTRSEETTKSLRVLDLFSGIGGFSLGLERAGMRTVCFCEIDPFCREVLRKHWPSTLCFYDIRGLSGDALVGMQTGQIDVICGGFPCQDISSASDNPAGIDGERSGLWKEFARLIREIRPRFAIVENVSALRIRGLYDILRDLAALGYDAEWHCIPASIFGAPHPRDRIWIVAYAKEMFGQAELGNQSSGLLSSDGLLAFLENEGRSEPITSWWATEPRVDRMVHGISDRVDRLGALANSLVPQIAEYIGRSIMRVVE